MRRLTHGTERCGRGALRATALLTLLIALLVAPTTAGAASPGGFDQLPNPLGCLQAGSGDPCTSVANLNGPYRIAISPDGKNLYATSFSDRITIYDRNTDTGSLKQKPGSAGCISDTGDGTTCADARHLNGPLGLTMTSDGRTLFVAADNANAVLVFSRNTSSGTITQKPNEAGCIANTPIVNDCSDGRALASPFDVALSSDQKHLYVTSFSSSAVSAMQVLGGELFPVSGPTGCVSNAATDGCTVRAGLANPWPVAISPNGQTVYAGGYSSNSIVALSRNSATGGLTPVGTAGCVSRDGTGGTCTTVPDLLSTRGIVVSQDSKHIYGLGQDRVLLLDRQSNGGLIRRAGDGGCVSNGAAAGCTTGRGLAMGEKGNVFLSPDNSQLYVASSAGGGGLTEQRLASDGSMSPRGDARGCAVSGTPPANCATATKIAGTTDVLVSPDGRNIYVATRGDSSIGVFKRDSAGPGCGDNSATVQAGSVTSLSLTCGDADGDALTRTITTPPGLGVLGNIDQGAGTVAFASSGVAGTASFKFRASSNGVASNEATFTINVVGTPPPPPPPPPPLTVVPSTTSISSLAFVKFTKLVNLSAKNLVAHSTVTVTCKTKKKKQQKKGCPYKKKSFKNTAAKANLNLRKPFAKKKVPVGTHITITITAPGFIGKQIRYTIRKRKLPKSRVLCIKPGAKPGKC
jgi:sugar lactone lactonase YvrE